MRPLVLAFVTVVAITACSRGVSVGSPAAARATASFVDTTNRAVGSATLSETSAGLKISGTVSGLAAGVHGMHIHTTGQCAGPAFATAGGHFNPAAKQHGTQNPAGPHMGDMPNVTVSSSGAFEVVAPGLTIAQITDADGSALIIHAAPDDYKTDPSGNSGARKVCGVVTKQ